MVVGPGWAWSGSPFNGARMSMLTPSALLDGKVERNLKPG
jgi:hypothetical protein